MSLNRSATISVSSRISRSDQKRSCASRQVRDRLEALALVAGELEVDLVGAQHPHLGRLDDGDGPVVEVEEQETIACLRERLVPVQPGGRGLVTAEHRIDELRRSGVRA